MSNSLFAKVLNANNISSFGTVCYLFLHCERGRQYLCINKPGVLGPEMNITLKIHLTTEDGNLHCHGFLTCEKYCWTKDQHQRGRLSEISVTCWCRRRDFSNTAIAMSWFQEIL